METCFSNAFQTLSCVLQGSILGPVLFDDLFLFIEEAGLSNFADDNTLYVSSKDLMMLLEILKTEFEIAIEWFNNIINTDKF